MSHPRRHRPQATESVALDAHHIVPLPVYAQLLDAYLADHPEFTAPRPGIRGHASRLGLPGLPEQWWVPYLLDDA